MKLALLVRSLERGGAERQLVVLAKAMQSPTVEVVVIVFYGGGPLEKELLDSGVRVVSLNKAGRWDLAGFTGRFLSVLKAERPDILYGFVVSPNLLGSLVKPLFPRMRIVWGVRSARSDLSAYDWVTRLVYRMEGRLSRLPDLIIVNSEAGRRLLAERGFPPQKVVWIANGIDGERFRPDPIGRARVRQEWGVQNDETLIGIVGRNDPVKAHEVFLEAAKLLLETDPRLAFVCVGIGELAATRVRMHAKSLGLEARLRVVGPRDDMPAIYSALDVNVMCSHSEGFPNVVGEAMACGVPCAVTEVGDAAEIVGELGERVPRAKPDELAQAVRRLLERLRADPQGLSRAVRQQIIDRYSLDKLGTRTFHALRLLGV